MSSDSSNPSFDGSDASDIDAGTGNGVDDEAPRPGLFAAPGFLRLWVAQVVSSFGDWIGLLATIEVARRIGGDQPGSPSHWW